jgi:hypothetical protein
MTNGGRLASTINPRAKWGVVLFLGTALVFVFAAFQRARVQADKHTCINSLRVLDGAKSSWAKDNDKRTGDEVRAKDLAAYFRNGGMPQCDAGGIYAIGSVGTAPTCSIPGHAIDAR